MPSLCTAMLILFATSGFSATYDSMVVRKLVVTLYCLGCDAAASLATPELTGRTRVLDSMHAGEGCTGEEESGAGGGPLCHREAAAQVCGDPQHPLLQQATLHPRACMRTCHATQKHGITSSRALVCVAATPERRSKQSRGLWFFAATSDENRCMGGYTRAVQGLLCMAFKLQSACVSSA